MAISKRNNDSHSRSRSSSNNNSNEYETMSRELVIIITLLFIRFSFSLSRYSLLFSSFLSPYYSTHLNILNNPGVRLCGTCFAQHSQWMISQRYDINCNIADKTNDRYTNCVTQFQFDRCLRIDFSRHVTNYRYKHTLVPFVQW